MSNTLERIVQRARSPLRRVEPLFPSRYALQNEAEAAPVEFSEETDAPMMRHTEGAPVPESHLPEVASRNAINAGKEDSTADQPQGQQPAGRVNGHEQQTVNRSASEQQNLSARSRSDRLLANEPERESDARAQKNQLPADIQTSATVIRDSKPPLPLAAPPARRAVPERGPRQRETSPMSVAPEVTISIGHIEVRAAQTLEPPRRPAFRPRVSLEDFLKQQERDRP